MDLPPGQSELVVELPAELLTANVRVEARAGGKCSWTIYKDLDAKIRSRLRRLLMKRHRKNPKRLPRQQRWPNAYFAAAGLYSLREAHLRFAQSVNY